MPRYFTAQHAFTRDPNEEGELSVGKGELLMLLEEGQDEHKGGWSCMQSVISGESGFVPTDWLEEVQDAMDGPSARAPLRTSAIPPPMPLPSSAIEYTPTPVPSSAIEYGMEDPGNLLLGGLHAPLFEMPPPPPPLPSQHFLPGAGRGVRARERTLVSSLAPLQRALKASAESAALLEAIRPTTYAIRAAIEAHDFDEACRRNGECYHHLTSTQHEAGEAMTKAAEVMGDRIARNVDHANSLARRLEDLECVVEDEKLRARTLHKEDIIRDLSTRQSSSGTPKAGSSTPKAGAFNKPGKIDPLARTWAPSSAVPAS